MRVLAVFLFLMLFLSLRVEAQQQQKPPLVTDRPDQTESATVQAAGSVQIETGLTARWKDHGSYSTQTTSIPALLVRTGIGEHFELRIAGAAVNQKVRSDGDEQDENGMDALGIGFKTDIARENGILPEIAFLGSVIIPQTGGESFSPSHIAPEFRFSFAHTLSEDFSLGYNLGLLWAGESPRHVGMYTIVLGYTVTDAIGVFAEVYGFLPDGDSPRHVADAGITVGLSDDFQLDASGGLGLSGAAIDSFLNAGFSWRLWW